MGPRQGRRLLPERRLLLIPPPSPQGQRCTALPSDRNVVLRAVRECRGYWSAAIARMLSSERWSVPGSNRRPPACKLGRRVVPVGLGGREGQTVRRHRLPRHPRWRGVVVRHHDRPGRAGQGTWSRRDGCSRGRAPLARPCDGHVERLGRSRQGRPGAKAATPPFLAGCPSPCGPGGNQWQPPATVLACLCGLGALSICQRSPLVATAGDRVECVRPKAAWSKRTSSRTPEDRHC